MLEDGRVLVAGGTQFFLNAADGDHHGHMPGLHDSATYDPFSRTWHTTGMMFDPSPLYPRPCADMRPPDDPHWYPWQGGRWYPTLVTAPSGSVVALSGHPSNCDIRHNNHLPEWFDPFTGTWTPFYVPPAEVVQHGLESEDFEVRADPKLYPRVHVLPNGLVFCLTPLGTVQRSQLIDPVSGARRFCGAPPPIDSAISDDSINLDKGVYWGNFYTQVAPSILLPLVPPRYAARVLICGGATAYTMDLTNVPADPSGLRAAGNPATLLYANQQHAFYRREDRSIQHILWDPQAGRFFADDWSVRTGALAAAGDPRTMVTNNPAQQHVWYRGDDGGIEHIFYDQPTNQVYFDNWTALTGAPPAAGEPATLRTDTPNQQHVFYRSADGAIQHLFCDVATSHVYHDTWTAIAQAPAAMGDPATLSTTDPNQQHIFYRGADGAIEHIFYDQPTNQVYYDNWTALTGAPPAAGEPATLRTDTPNQQHVFYRSADGAIQHLFCDVATNHVYHDTWTAIAQAPAAMGDPATLGTTDPNQQHIFYRGADGAIEHIFYDQPTNGVYHDTWTSLTAAPPAAGDPATLLSDSPNQQHVFYRAADGAIQHIFADVQTNQLYTDNWTDPAWVPTGNRSVAWPRYNCDALLLPTGDVFVTGGCKTWRTDSDAARNPEIYHPESDSWELLPAEATVPRDYHSVALLMPDGRVWTAGSNINGQQSFVYLPDSDDQDPSVDMRERRIEIFEPDYFSRPDRPRIDSAPGMVSHAQTFHVSSADAAAVARIAILRTGSVTHSYNSDQRYIVLDFRRSGETELEVVAPPDASIAPPGYYLLFLLNADGIPSIGTFLRVALPRQHVFYWDINARLQHFVASASTGLLPPEDWGGPINAPPPSGLSVMATAEPDQLHAFYSDPNGDIQHIFWDGPTIALHKDNWSKSSTPPAPQAAANCRPAALHTVNPNQQHVFYRGAAGSVEHIFLDVATSTLYRDSWSHLTRAPDAVGEPAVLAFDNPNQQHVFYRSADGHIQHIFYDQPTNQLYHDTWTAATGAPLAAGDPATMVTSQPSQQHVFYRGVDGAIQHIFHDQASNALYADTWTTPNESCVGDPVTMVSGLQQHVFFRSPDGSLRHIFVDPATGAFWRETWTSEAGAPDAVDDPVTLVSPHQQHVFYCGTDQSIHHILWDDRTSAFYHDTWGGPGALAGGPTRLAAILTPVG
jgi:hypothetical protein